MFDLKTRFARAFGLDFPDQLAAGGSYIITPRFSGDGDDAGFLQALSKVY